MREKINRMTYELCLHGDEVFSSMMPRLVEAYRLIFDCEPESTSYSYNLWKTLTGTTPYFMEAQSGNLKMIVVRSKLQMEKQKKMKQENQNIRSDKDVHCPEWTVPSNIISGNYQMGDTTDITFAEIVETKESIPKGTLHNDAIVDVKAGQMDTEIKRWLEKPVVVSQGTFQSTDGPTTFSNIFWEKALDNTMMKNKMSGTFSIKADLVLTLVVNGNPFQLGLYCLAWLPTGGSFGSTATAANWILMHRANLTHITQLQHEKLDVACDSRVSLTVPWKSGLNSFPYLSTASNFGTPGVFFLYPIVPISTPSGSLTASYTLYASYSNIELGTVGYPQMGSGRVAKKKDLLSREEEKGGPVNQTLVVASQVSDSLSKIPLLSSIAGPATFILDSLANMAYTMGWDKPTTTEPPCIMVRHQFPGSQNIDGVDTCESLALSRTNHVGIHPEIVGSNFDQMHFNYIKQIYAWRSTTTWNLSDPIDTTVVSFNVDPGHETSTTDSGATLYHQLPLCHVHRHFAMWRGDIKFRFTLVKTAFHSGRLLISFEPIVDGQWTPSATTTALSQYLLRTIVDVKEESVVEITVPFVSIQPWLLQGKYTGVLRVLVLDPLKAPASVSSTISLVTEIAGADNLEWSTPRRFTSNVIVPSSYQSGSGEIAKRCLISSTNIGNGTSPDWQELTSVTHGEKVVSFRQLIKRNEIVYFASIGSIANDNIFAPFSSFLYRCNGVGVSGTSITVTNDLYTRLSSMFLFSRGGVRLRFMSTSTNTTQSQWLYLERAGYLTTALTTWNNVSARSFAGFLYDARNQPLTCFSINSPPSGYLIPQNTNTLCRINAVNCFNGTDSLDPVYSLIDPARVHTLQQGATTIPIYVGRSGADDCDFSGFVSVPPMYADTSPA